MRRLTIVAALVALAAPMIFIGGTEVLAARQPEITTVVEGRLANEMEAGALPGSDRGALVAFGKSLRKVKLCALQTLGGEPIAGRVDIVRKSNTMLLLGMPDDLEEGYYELVLHCKGDSYSYPFYFEDGGTRPYAVGMSNLELSMFGPGVDCWNGQIQVDFDANGTSPEAARSDHQHPVPRIVLSDEVETSWVNGYDAPLSYSVPEGAVMTGLYSTHSNDREDRIWKVRYRYLSIETD